MPKYDVKNESGRKMIATLVSTRTALPVWSADMLSSFC
jgi:hypothetical protein